MAATVLLELSAYRLRHKLTYRALAAKVGLSYYTVYRMLNGQARRPYETTVDTVRDFLKAEELADARRAAETARKARRARARARGEQRVSP